MNLIYRINVSLECWALNLVSFNSDVISSSFVVRSSLPLGDAAVDAGRH